MAEPDIGQTSQRKRRHASMGDKHPFAAKDCATLPVNATPGLAKILGYSHMDQLCHRAFGHRRCAILAAALLLATTHAAAADDVENFYHGRTLTVVISFSV